MYAFVHTYKKIHNFLKIAIFEKISQICENQQILLFSALFCIELKIFSDKVFKSNISK